jgi:hypothetical protein
LRRVLRLGLDLSSGTQVVLEGPDTADVVVDGFVVAQIALELMADVPRGASIRGGTVMAVVFLRVDRGHLASASALLRSTQLALSIAS